MDWVWTSGKEKEKFTISAVMDRVLFGIHVNVYFCLNGIPVELKLLVEINWLYLFIDQGTDKLYFPGHTFLAALSIWKMLSTENK